jgi:hypothetical protein
MKLDIRNTVVLTFKESYVYYVLVYKSRDLTTWDNEIMIYVR